MFHACFRLIGSARFFVFLLVAVVLLQGSISLAVGATGAPKFEVPANQKVSDVLPPELIAGPNFRVRDNVVSYGYMNSYVVDSDYGTFQVTGDFALRKLIREIWAIGALSHIKKSDAYISGLKKAASQPLEFGQNMLTDPVDTVSAVPQGVARLFGNVKTGMTTKQSSGEDSTAKQALAVSSAKRELASRLGVDVYSSNSVLQKELNSIAWATALGSLSLSVALAPVGGPAVAAVSVTRMSQQMSDVLKDYPPTRLREMNQQKLQAMGVSTDVVTRFLEHPSYTPTHQTVIVGALETLTGAKGREAFILQALSASDEESANYFMNMAGMLKSYQGRVSPIREISAMGPLVFAKAGSGMAFIPLPLDRGIWTERAGQRVPEAVASYKAAHPDVKKFEAWVSGTVSKPAKEGLAKLGIAVVEKTADRIEYKY